MASIRETILAESFARLTATAYAGVSALNVRRTHLTAVDRDHAPAVRQIDGEDSKRSGAPGSKGSCAQPREVAWKISIITRSDADGHLQADALMLEVMDRFVAPWPPGVVVKYGSISYDNEIADEDVSKLDIEFIGHYQTPEWQLDVSA